MPKKRKSSKLASLSEKLRPFVSSDNKKWQKRFEKSTDKTYTHHLNVVMDTDVFSNDIPFMRLDKDVIHMASRREMLKYALPEKRVEFELEWIRVRAQLNVAIVRSLHEEGLLSEFLEVDGCSLGWMFQGAEENERDLESWGRLCLDKGRRGYLAASLRFLKIFMINSIQNHVVTGLVDALPMVTLAYGDYQSTVEVSHLYQEWLKKGNRSEDDPDITLVHLMCYEASALSCMGRFVASNTKFDEAEELFLETRKRLESSGSKDGGPRSKRAPKVGRIDLDRKHFTLKRERLRCLIRRAWMDLEEREWPILRANVPQRELALSLFDELKNFFEDAEISDCEPTDLDTIARASVFLAEVPRDVTAYAGNQLKRADSSWRTKRSSVNTEGSDFMEDTLQTTRALLLLAEGKHKEALDEVLSMEKSLSIDKRIHTRRPLSTLKRLASKGLQARL